MSFNHSLDNSLNVLKTAMEENKGLEGDEDVRNAALEKIKVLSRTIWKDHVVKEIK